MILEIMQRLLMNAFLYLFSAWCCNGEQFHTWGFFTSLLLS